MRVVVTGGAGFIGREACRVLARRDDVELVVSLDVRPPRGIGGPGGCQDKLVHEIGDVARLEVLLRVLTRHHIQAIVALAALLPEGARADPWQAVQTNGAGVANCLEAARLLGLHRVVLASSIAVHGSQQGGTLYDESSPFDPNSLYGWTKAFDEAVAAAYEAHGVDAVALRIGFVFGPGRERGVGAWADRFVRDALELGRCEIPCRPEQEILYTYVTWVGEVLAELALASRVPHRVFHSGGLTVTARQMGEALRALVPGLEVGYQEAAEPLPFISRVDATRLERFMGRRHPPLSECLQDHVRRVRAGPGV